MLQFVRSRLLAACVASTVTALVVGGVAWAVAPAGSPVDANGVIHACFNPANGNVHLNVTGSPCPSNPKFPLRNTGLEWNVQGPVGPKGDASLPGAKFATFANVPVGPNPTGVVSTGVLAPGHYILMLTMSAVSGDGSHGRMIRCAPSATSPAMVLSDDGANGVPGYGATQAMVTPTSPSSYDVVCVRVQGSGAPTATGQLTVMPVAVP